MALIIRKMQIKITKHYHVSQVKMAIIEKTRNSKCWKGRGGKGNLVHYWWDCKLVQPLWETVWRFRKN